MAHPEILLLTRVIDEGAFQVLEDNGLTSTHFSTEEGRHVFRVLSKAFHNQSAYGKTPSIDRVLHQVPGFAPIRVPDDTDTLVADVRAEQLVGALAQLSNDISDLAERRQLTEAVALLVEKSGEFSRSSRKSRDLTLATAVETIEDRYNLVQQGGGLLGIPTPWEPMTQETLGFQPGQFIVLYGRPGSMKCVCEGERIMAPDGALVPIESARAPIPSFTEETGRIRWADARYVRSGLKDCVRVTTALGKQLRTSDEHLYMVPGGYERAHNLNPGDWVATARRYPDWTPSSNLKPWEGHFLGLLVGDGNYTRGEVQFTNKDREVVQTVQRYARRFECRLNQSPNRGIEYRITGAHTRGHNPVLNWLRDLDIHDQSSRQKRVPEVIFRSSKETILAFLAGLLDTDGSVYAPNPTVVWYMSSHRLALDIQHLLLRFDIQVHVGYVESRDSWQVACNAIEQLRALYLRLGRHICHIRKSQTLRQMVIRDTKSNRNVDTIPHTDQLYALILSEKERSGMPWPKMGRSKLDRSKLFRRSGCISRTLLAKLANAFDSDALWVIVDSDVCWEQVKAIEPIGEVMCHDMCIEDGLDPDFVVGDFVVHNSWMGIQIAIHAYWANQRVLFYTREMEPVEIMQRVAAAATSVGWGDFRKGKLQPDLKREVFAMLHELSSDEEIIETSTGIRKGLHVTNASDLQEIGNTVNGLAKKAEEYKADIIVADGIYRMGDSRTHSRTVDWKNMYHISQDLKDTAQRLRVPIIGITQGSQRSQGKDIAYADAFLQDADLAFRIVLSQMHKHLTFITPKLREGVVPAFTINAIPASDFRLKAVLDADEAERIIAEEEEEEQQKKKGKGKGKGSAAGGATQRRFTGPLRV